MLINALCSLQFILLSAGPIGGTLHVPANYPTIQACIDAATSGFDECVVAPDIYHETINFLGKAITVRSSGGRDVTTIDATGIGGSVVTCDSGEGPDTSLDGFRITGGTGTVYGSQTYGGGMYNVNSAPRVGLCTFDGNTANYGGGIYNQDSSPLLATCTFSDNTASDGGGMDNHFSAPTLTHCTFNGNTAYNGGGIYNQDSSPTVFSCILDGNTATNHGGGIYNTYSNPIVIDCTFSDNTASNGGGMSNVLSTPVLTACNFNGNAVEPGFYKYSGNGGGMYNYLSGATVAHCTFSDNIANGAFDGTSGLGGGMYNYGGTIMVNETTFHGNISLAGGGIYDDDSSPTLTHCTFSENLAVQGGGGLFNAGGSPTVSRCTFTANSSYWSGGGMYNAISGAKVSHCTFSVNTAYGNGGGGMVNYGSTTTVTNCAFNGNIAAYEPLPGAVGGGGGMYNVSSIPSVTNCTFSGNMATDYSRSGGGMLNDSSIPTVTNCTFSGNAATYGGGMYNHGGRSALDNCIMWGDTPNEILGSYDDVSASIRFSNMQGGLSADAIDGSGNFDLDPMFVRPPDPGPDGNWDGVDDDYGDLRLLAGSPCINAGDPAFVAQPGETDLDAHARVLCERIDMGAYEFGIGDYDCDEVVNLTDFANWSACMTGPHSGPCDGGCETFDFDAEGDVDLRDFAAFQNAYLPK